MKTLQEILKITGTNIHKNIRLNGVLQKLHDCGTSANGYNLYKCSNDDCGEIKIQYHSCHNRHCPRCNGMRTEQWKEARQKELLPINYFHIVFTVPHELNSLIMGNMNVLYRLMFDASLFAINTVCKQKYYLKITPGIISVLHTWGQQLSYHPHIHCIVSGGGLNNEGQWKSTPILQNGFFLPIVDLRVEYRNYFITNLEKLICNKSVKISKTTDWDKLKASVSEINWNVYIKEAMQGGEKVIEYLGRYSAKIAISNHRIKQIDENNNVIFEYKDYSDDEKKKLMTLKAEEFIRRFSLHILPKGFVKIRKYGYLANNLKDKLVDEILSQMKLPLSGGRAIIPFYVRMLEKYGIDIFCCPKCKRHSLELVSVCFPSRASPLIFKKFRKQSEKA